MSKPSQRLKLQTEIDNIEELNRLERKFEIKELERQKRQLEARTVLKSMPVCGSQDLQS